MNIEFVGFVNGWVLVFFNNCFFYLVIYNNWFKIIVFREMGSLFWDKYIVKKIEEMICGWILGKICKFLVRLNFYWLEDRVIFLWLRYSVKCFEDRNWENV